MSWLFGWLLDVTPWWVWLLACGALLAATYQLWWPLWLALPRPVKAAIGGAAAIILAWSAGRRQGASNATQRAKEQDEANAKRIDQSAASARAAADARNVGDGLRRDDGWRRD